MEKETGFIPVAAKFTLREEKGGPLGRYFFPSFCWHGRALRVRIHMYSVEEREYLIKVFSVSFLQGSIRILVEGFFSFRLYCPGHPLRKSTNSWRTHMTKKYACVEIPNGSEGLKTRNGSFSDGEKQIYKSSFRSSHRALT